VVIPEVKEKKKKKFQNIQHRKRFKKCDRCNETENEIAAKKCKACGETIAKKRKSYEEMVPAGAINATLQKDIIHSRMLGLNMKQDIHAFVVYIKKGKNTTMDSYSTPGFASDFLGTKEKLTDNGELLLKLFKQEFEDKYARIRTDSSFDKEDNGEIGQKTQPTETVVAAETATADPDILIDNQLVSIDMNIENRLATTSFSTGDAVAAVKTPIGNVVEGVSVMGKENLKFGDILVVYAEEGDDDRFWLLKVNEAGTRSIEGFWFNKTKDRHYTIGSPEVIKWINVAHPFKKGKNVYIVYLNEESDACFLLPAEAERFLNENI